MAQQTIKDLNLWYFKGHKYGHRLVNYLLHNLNIWWPFRTRSYFSGLYFLTVLSIPLSCWLIELYSCFKEILYSATHYFSIAHFCNSCFSFNQKQHVLMLDSIKFIFVLCFYRLSCATFCGKFLGNFFKDIILETTALLFLCHISSIKHVYSQ